MSSYHKQAALQHSKNCDEKCSLVDGMITACDSAPCDAVGPQHASGIEDEDMFMFQATPV